MTYSKKQILQKEAEAASEIQEPVDEAPAVEETDVAALKARIAELEKATEASKPKPVFNDAGEELTLFRIDLAKNSNSISHAGKTYFHGHSYPVTKAVMWDLQEVCNRSHAHEATLHENENMGRRPRPQYA
jgi:hypothetical protein